MFLKRSETGCRIHSRFIVVVTACLLFVPTGCSKEELKDIGQGLVDEGKKIAGSATEAVQERLPATGSIELGLPSPLRLETASIELISVGDGRPSVVQIASYDTEKGPPAGPSVLIHATTTANSIAALADQTIPCSLFLRTAPSGPVTRTPAGKPIRITFSSPNTDDKTVRATIEQGMMETSDGSSMSLTSGTAVAVIKGGA